MKLIYYTKTTLKGMVSNGAVTLLYYILFPVLLAAFMGFFQKTLMDSPLKLTTLKVQINDMDNSTMSKNLVSFLESNDMKELVELTDKKANVEISIPKGYENNVVSLKRGEININKLEEGYSNSTNTLKTILDKYHESLYVNLSGGSTEDLAKVSGESVIEKIDIDSKKTSSSYEKMAASMIAFVISMLIFTLIQSNYAEVSVNLDKRVASTPVTRKQYFYYDSFALFVYSTVIISGYVFFFRISGISFTGGIFPLLILILTSSMLVVSLSKFVYTFFGAKYGKVVGALIFTLPIIGMEMFTGEGNALKVLSPTHYISKLFTLYNLNGSFSANNKDLILILSISIILFIIAILKISLSKEERRCA
ncbi:MULTISPECIES: ABC transporter permease [unclassified Clostridium]|uniref:ABC transporter permease n=1 Tax=unclassified Clostridium TaxID=2614128 RepID=UPI001897A5E1|nr:MULTISPECIES: ABC transporter permease [unclassified Clostridium]